jgi:autotransporter-associated beta strand protein
MKIKPITASTPLLSPIPKLFGRFPWPRQLRCALGLAGILLALGTAQAATTLIWDPSSNGASDGSGTWHGGNTWWNGTADQAWADASAGIIGTNTSGVYSINLDSAAAVASLLFKTNNYTLGGSSTLTLNGAVTLSSGVIATINCPMVAPNGAGFSVGNGSTLTLGGGWAATPAGNPNFNGNNQATSTLNITNGTYSSLGTWTLNNITINQSGGAFTFNAFNIGRTAAAIYNLSGGSLRTAANGFQISRGFAGIVNVSGTGLLGAVGNVSIASTTTTDNGTLNVLGGTANIGTGIGGIPGVSSASLGNINMLAASGTYAAAAKAALNISGGVTTAKGILFGNAAGVYSNHPASQVNVSGGQLYLDSGGIGLTSIGVTGFATPIINLSGGILAATATWTGTLPMSLNNTNGELTVQAADTNGTPFNITLSGGLSGTGGLLKTGGGILTLSGTNNYSGSTTVANGQLTVSTLGATSIGAVSLTNSGTTLSTVLTAAGRSWTNTGLDLTNGVTLDFNFGGFEASPSSRVIQVNGDLTLDSSDVCTIEGTAIIVGTFPLMTCTGKLTLTGGASLPTVTSLPAGVSATLAQSGKTINLVVTASPNSPLNWGPLAAGPWDFSTMDWVNAANGSPTNYSDGIAVNLNDNAQSAVVIALNNNVQPVSVTANNTAAGTASYTIVGPGSIGGNTSVLLQGTGLLALGATNTYTGGTTVNSGTLGINYGGDGSGPSGIGSGPLTLNVGAAIDNTSGSNVVLNTPLTENWNGDFTYAGSQTNLDLGTGPVVLGNNVAVTVLSNRLTCGGNITDNGLHYQLAVQGPGALTLSGFNTYSGGTVLNSGKLNINNGGDGGPDSALGIGTFTINGGTIDNTSGADVQLQTSVPESWVSSFTFAGTANLDLGSGAIVASALTLTLQNGATLSTEGGITAAGSGGVAPMTLNGNGTFRTSGSHNNLGTTLTVNGGLFQMDKASSASVHSLQGGLILNTNGTARVTGTGGQQIISTSLGPVTLSGGTLDLFGSSEKMYSITFNSGTLQNSSTNTPATLTLTTSNNLKGAACKFDVATNSEMAIPSLIAGTGSLIKIGAGTLDLGGTNTYTGSTTVSDGLLSFTTATLANRNYTVASGELEAILDPTGTQLQMTMSNLTFDAGTRLGFDLASGAFGDTTVSLISASTVTLIDNVAVDVTNAPGDTADDVLLSYTSRQGTGDFVAGNVPAGAFIYDNAASRKVILTYTQPLPPPPSFSAIGSVFNGGGVLTGITFSAIHGPAGGAYDILSSTDVTLQPLSAWTPVHSGTFDGSGKFNVTISVNPATPKMFYLLRVP